MRSGRRRQGYILRISVFVRRALVASQRGISLVLLFILLLFIRRNCKFAEQDISKYTIEVVSSLHSASSFLFLLGPGVYKPGKSFCTSGLSKSSIGSVQVNNYQYIVNKLLRKSIECLFCLGRPLHQSADFCLRGAKTVLILRYNGLALRFSR